MNLCILKVAQIDGQQNYCCFELANAQQARLVAQNITLVSVAEQVVEHIIFLAQSAGQLDLDILFQSVLAPCITVHNLDALRYQVLTTWEIDSFWRSFSHGLQELKEEQQR